jgi:hypothetical protein
MDEGEPLGEREGGWDGRGVWDVRVRTSKADALDVGFVPPSQADTPVAQRRIRVRQRLIWHGPILSLTQTSH